MKIFKLLATLALFSLSLVNFAYPKPLAISQEEIQKQLRYTDDDFRKLSPTDRDRISADDYCKARARALVKQAAKSMGIKKPIRVKFAALNSHLAGTATQHNFTIKLSTDLLYFNFQGAFEVFHEVAHLKRNSQEREMQDTFNHLLKKGSTSLGSAAMNKITAAEELETDRTACNYLLKAGNIYAIMWRILLQDLGITLKKDTNPKRNLKYGHFSSQVELNNLQKYLASKGYKIVSRNVSQGKETGRLLTLSRNNKLIQKYGYSIGLVNGKPQMTGMGSGPLAK